MKGVSLMSTHSSIAVRMKNGNIGAVYCHWNGDIKNNGKRLIENYNSQKLAERVVKLGYISYLGKSMNKPKGHTMATPVDGYSIVYGRDRGRKEDLECTTHVFETDEEYQAWIVDRDDFDFNYFWDGNKWLVNNESMNFNKESRKK